MKKNIVLAMLFAAALPAAAKTPTYKNPKAPIEERVEDLLGRMTLEEKVLQLTQYVHGEDVNPNNMGYDKDEFPLEAGSYIYYDPNAALRNQRQERIMKETRLGIPAIFAKDVIHGYRTVYPISLAQACSFNPALVEAACAVAASESRLSGTDWTFSPMIDVARDPRWGRISEGYGEDPLVNAVMAAAAVKGYQGTDMSDPQRMAACLKHYVGYGASEGGRDYRPANISDNDLWNIYLPPYKAGVDAGAATVMSSFNDINGVPGSANYYTLTTILKDMWGFDGAVVSDWGSVDQIVTQGVAEDGKDAARQAFNTGVEIDMADGLYEKYLAALVAEGKVDMARIDDAVRRVLRLKFRLGLFERPFTPEIPESERLMTPQNLETARQLARESIVLLKNEGNILPLATQNIALIGPAAKEPTCFLGNWHCQGREEEVETIYDGFAKLYGADNVKYARGCAYDGNDESGFAEAVALAEGSDAVVLCMGEHGYWSGENESRSHIELQPVQQKLIAELKKTGKPLVLVLANGRPLALGDVEPMVDAIVEVWQPGIAGGTPVAEVLTGAVNPSGKLSASIPYSTGQIPVYYNRRRNARTTPQGDYHDGPSLPLYEFGHGLSYTTLEYSDIRRNDDGTFSIDVRNTGNRDANEAVLWFISVPVAPIARPVKELVHFEKQPIAAGASATFTLALTPEMLSTHAPDGKLMPAPTHYTLSAGPSSVEIK